MRRTLLTCAVVLASVAAVGTAGAGGYRNFVSLTGGPNHIWNPFAEVILAIFEADSKTGYGGSLGYGTRLGRDSHFVFYGCYAYDRMRTEVDFPEIENIPFNQVRANLRYYIGRVSEGPAAYVGLGPVVMFTSDDAGLNGNLSIGGDFPVGYGWSVLVDGTVDLVWAYGHVGLAYWFE